jgi:GrpB-like predicted nucleotidyltransferase (UPF0157 family)
MFLGLKRGTVRLVDHQPDWQQAFISERALLARLLMPTALEIEHVGSTAVPGLVAKPVLDLACAVASLDQTAGWPEKLAPHGFEFFGDRENRGEHFYAKGSDDCRTLYLHVVPIDRTRWSDYVRFRDLLRSDERLRACYAKAKLIAASAHSNDRTAYTAAKEKIIHEILG